MHMECVRVGLLFGGFFQMGMNYWKTWRALYYRVEEFLSRDGGKQKRLPVVTILFLCCLRKQCPVFVWEMHPWKENHCFLITVLIALLKFNLWAIAGHRGKRRNFSNVMILLNVGGPLCQKLKVQSLFLVSQIIKQTTCFCLDYFIWFR